MLATFRRSLNTWPARLLFMLLVAAFVIWGIGDVVRNIARDSAPLRVAGQQHRPARSCRRNSSATWRRPARNLGNSDPTPEIRRSVALQTVQQVVTQTALDAEAQRLRLAVPDDALRRAVFAMPAFRDKDGKFDRALMDNLLRNNGLTEPRFLDLMREQLLHQQMLDAVSAGAARPGRDGARWSISSSTRSASPTPSTCRSPPPPPPPAPTDKQLERWWANHPDRYSTPEYRRIKAIVLSPETVAQGRAGHRRGPQGRVGAATRASSTTPEKRSVEVILTQDAGDGRAARRAVAQRRRLGADAGGREQGRRGPGRTRPTPRAASSPPRNSATPCSPRPRTRCRRRCTARSAGTC